MNKVSLPFTSVVSLHTNPTTCGVAKFSTQLAERLGVPFRGLGGGVYIGKHPLFSLKYSELGEADRLLLSDHSDILPSYSVFWHDTGVDYFNLTARHVFYADKSLGSPDLFCPSLIPTKKRPVRLFTFGMAGKQPIEHYRKVRQLLDASEQPYHLRVSVGIHEGTSLDRVERHFDELREVMGPEHVTILGILTDDAVSDELANADYTLAFFDKGARANNTTIHAAITSRSGVITNWDKDTPLFFYQATKNIDHLTSWPERPGVHTTPYTWDELLRQMNKLCNQSPSTAAK